LLHPAVRKKKRIPKKVLIKAGQLFIILFRK
jgi:hypothetical protein